jgi:hypothetical protein
MNERIKLPPQDWLGYDPERGDIHGYTFEQMREFAELIVRECVDIVEKLPSGHNDYRDQIEDGFRRDCIEKMKYHFGVE